MLHIGRSVNAVVGAFFLAAALGAAAQPARSQRATIPAVTGTMLKMQSPKFSAGPRDGQHYEVAAASATQMLDRNDETTLEQPRVELGYANGTVLRLSGTTALLRLGPGSLSLHGNVVLVDGSGRSIDLGDATVDLRNNTLLSEKPIVTTLKTDLIRGHHLEISESGAMILVYGAIVRPEGVVFFDRYLLD